MKTIKLLQSPFQPPIDYAYGLTFQIHVPYNKESVTLLINPSINDYKEKDGNKDIEIRQLVFSQHTKETKEVSFDFKTKNTQVIENDGNNIEVKLQHIGTEKIQGQDFLYFEFLVSEV